MSAALRGMAAAIERGSSLEQAIAACGGRIPAYMAGFLKAAEKTGKLGVVLTEWVENQWAVRARRRTVVSALTYPLVSLAMTLAVFLLLAVVLAPTFKDFMSDFGLKLQLPTLIFFWLSDVVVPVLAAGGAALLLGVFAVRLFGGRAATSQLIGALPLAGKIWYWSGSVEGLRAVGLLVENDIPLPEALVLAGDGISDAYIGQGCRTLGKRVEQGEPLWEALLRTRIFPMSIIPVIRQGEQQGALDSSLRTAAQMLEDRIRSRSTLLLQILPPAIFLLVAFMIAMFFAAMYLPMISLIQGLS